MRAQWARNLIITTGVALSYLVPIIPDMNNKNTRLRQIGEASIISHSSKERPEEI